MASVRLLWVWTSFRYYGRLHSPCMGSSRGRAGGIYFAILIAMPDGRHARYHLRRPLAAPQGAWTTNQWRLQDLKRRDWWCSFASNKQSCKAMPAVPDLCHVEAIEIVMTDGSLPPTGLLKMRNLRVLQ